MKKYFLYTMAAAFVFAAVFTSCETDKVEEVPMYTVRFDSKGGTPTPQEQTVREGGKVTKPADPARDNYSFTGWAKTDSETAALWNFETETVSDSYSIIRPKSQPYPLSCAHQASFHFLFPAVLPHLSYYMANTDYQYLLSQKSPAVIRHTFYN